MEAEQPEQPRRVRAQCVIGPGEHRSGIGGGVPAVEGIQGVDGLAQLCGHDRQREPGGSGSAGGHDRQRQRQPRASLDDLAGRRGIGRDLVLSKPPDEEITSLSGGEHFQGQRPGAIGGNQPGQVVAAGDDGHAGGRAGQQWPHLIGIAGVVQDHQHPLACQQAAVQRGLGVQVGRGSRHRHSQRVEQAAQRLGRPQRRPARVKPPQVHIQLAIGESCGHPVRPVHGQGCLAHPGGARYHRDHHGARPGCASPCLGHARVHSAGHQGVQAGQLGSAAGETGHRRWQLRWSWRLPHHRHGRRRRERCRRGRGCIEGRVLPQDGRLQLSQPLAGVDAQLLAQDVPQTVIGRQGIGLPARPVQRHHQHRVELLIERGLGEHLLQPGH